MHTNRLSREKSPYLLQHQHNPVDWYAWGEEAFQAAREANKPIFLSIGYSTCYWCHVMERDSFEQEDVAAVLNRDFISIKLDREERPDVDKVYMDTVVALTGHGGWPMSVFLTPELKPFFGGTFFWRAQFLVLLERITELWRFHRSDVERSAVELIEYLGKTSVAAPAGSIAAKELAQRAYNELAQNYDNQAGGFGTAPKFPAPEKLLFLLRLAQSNGEAAQMAINTLEQMARGGICDHLGGGFHRYSTDAEWLIPHFEKMLYDNALLLSAYLEGVQYLKSFSDGSQLSGSRLQLFTYTARRTAQYLLGEMRAPEGGFFSAEDAGDVGKEGEYYVWSAAELKSILGPDGYSLLASVFSVSDAGNFENGMNALAMRGDVSCAELMKPEIQEALTKLRLVRSKRERPRLDDKVLVAWSALAISACAQAYRVLGDRECLAAAEQSAKFIWEKLYSDDGLLRRYRAGEAKFAACLDDYAFLVRALIDLYQADFNIDWIDWAVKLQAEQDQNLLDCENGGYYFAAKDNPELFIAKREFVDNAEPSGNGIAASNLIKLSMLTGNLKYRSDAEKIFLAGADRMERYPSSCASMQNALMELSLPGVQIVVASTDSQPEQLLAPLWLRFLPGALIVFTNQSVSSLALLEGKCVREAGTKFYLCHQGVCEAPVETVAEVLAALSSE